MMTSTDDPRVTCTRLIGTIHPPRQPNRSDRPATLPRGGPTVRRDPGPAGEPVKPTQLAPCVLVADDDEGVRSLLARILKHLGARALIARDGIGRSTSSGCTARPSTSSSSTSTCPASAV
jgi:hypothetical protein